MGMCFSMLFNHRAKYKMPFWSSKTENILKTPNILRKQCRCMWGKCEKRLFPENFLGFGVLQHTRAAVEHWFSCLEERVTNEYKNYRLLGFCSQGNKAGFESEEAKRKVCLWWGGAGSGKCFLLSRGSCSFSEQQEWLSQGRAGKGWAPRISREILKKPQQAPGTGLFGKSSG